MLKNVLTERLETGIELFIFGSAARGDYSFDSDIDVLIVFDGTVTNTLEENIFDIAYEVGLMHSVVFGVIVYPRDLWYSPKGSGMPLYESVSKDGYQDLKYGHLIQYRRLCAKDHLCSFVISTRNIKNRIRHETQRAQLQNGIFIVFL